MTSARTRPAPLLALAVVLALAAGMVVVLALPAAAVHQHCDEGTEGIYLGKYPDFVRSNGHPLPNFADAKSEVWGKAWSGKGGRAAQLQVALHSLESALKVTDAIAAVIGAHAGEPVQGWIEVEKQVAKGIMAVVRPALKGAMLHLDHQSGAINACSGTFLGDTVDALFIASMEEDLARLGAQRAEAGHTGTSGGSVASSGTVGGATGAAMFLLPDDGNPDWTPYGTRYHGYAGHGEADLEDIGHNHGFADDPNIGMAVVVRNTIAHLVAHGVDVGKAKEHWKLAMAHLQRGFLLDAHALFADAYHEAVTADGTLTSGGH